LIIWIRIRGLFPLRRRALIFYATRKTPTFFADNETPLRVKDFFLKPVNCRVKVALNFIGDYHRKKLIHIFVVTTIPFAV